MKWLVYHHITHYCWGWLLNLSHAEVMIIKQYRNWQNYYPVLRLISNKSNSYVIISMCGNNVCWLGVWNCPHKLYVLLYMSVQITFTNIKNGQMTVGVLPKLTVSLWKPYKPVLLKYHFPDRQVWLTLLVCRVPHGWWVEPWLGQTWSASYFCLFSCTWTKNLLIVLDKQCFSLDKVNLFWSCRWVTVTFIGHLSIGQVGKYCFSMSHRATVTLLGLKFPEISLCTERTETSCLPRLKKCQVWGTVHTCFFKRTELHKVGHVGKKSVVCLVMGIAFSVCFSYAMAVEDPHRVLLSSDVVCMVLSSVYNQRVSK